FFPGEEPLGKRLIYDDGDKKVAREIVGVAADVKHESLADEDAPEVYVPFAQHPQGEMFFAVRAAGDPAALAAPLKGAVLEVDRDLPIYSVQTMQQRLDTSVAPQRFNTLLLVIFASLAMLLAAVGVFGVMSYTVAQRTHEIGIRMALGAQARDVLKLVVVRGMALALTGIAIGLICAFSVTRVMSSLLFGVSASDPLTFIGVSVLLAATALLACLIPARRAMRVDPMVALRYE
ncbi:MAG TPA: FtsX-like permease family protein, partial [Pyrinomonadaceae bacterium]|nr:FtsX-like permease family protein [Pyrinomonadaceae bacterium]